MPGKHSPKKKVYLVDLDGMEHYTDDVLDLSHVPVGVSIKVVEMTEKQYLRIPARSSTGKFFGQI